MPEPSQREPRGFLERLAELEQVGSFTWRLWLGAAGCALLCGILGLMMLGRAGSIPGPSVSFGSAWFAWLLLAVSWCIPCIGLLAAWRISSRQQRQRISAITAFAAAIHRSQPEFYGESDLQKLPDELRPLADAVNTLEIRYHHAVQALQQEARSARVQRDNLHHVFNSANVMLFGLDHSGDLRLMNVAAEHISGYAQPELENRAWHERVFPLPQYTEGRNIFDRLQQGEPPPRTFDAAMLSKSGKEYVIQWFCSEILQAEADITYSLAGIDVTNNRRQALDLHTDAARLEQIVRQARVGTANLTSDGYFENANRNFCDFLGTSPADLLSKTYADIVHPDDAKQAMTALRQLADSEQTLDLRISRYIRADGTIAWGAVTASGQPAHAQHDGVFGILVTILDVSPYKRIEEELRSQTTTLEQRLHRQEHQLEDAQTELREFVSIASHDLKTPLRGISRLAYWLAQEYADSIDEHGQEMTNMLIAQVRRLDKLIDGLLEYSRVGQQLEPPVPIDLRRFVNQLLMTLPVPQHIEIAVSSNLPTIVAHPGNMRRLFKNLLNNAIQFLDKPAGSIAITCQAADDVWVFKVRDNGPGIESKYHQKIFHIFEALDAKDLSANIGIGLALVKKIVTGYGGDIWVESTPGSGSTFIFTLPKHE